MEALCADIERTSDVRRLLGSLDGRTAEFKSMDYAKMSNEERITSKLLEHGMIMRFDSVIRGATVDLYRFAPGMGVKMAKLRNYADDVQMVLGATGVRVLAPIPGTSLVGFEVPASERRFPDMPEANGCELAIGETVDGQVRRFDLREAPHMLVAGSTGSGKSVFLHSVIRQLMQTDAELILIDPKQVEFSEYGCAITGYADIADALRSMVNVMESRYGILKADGKRNAIDAGMNPLVGVIDEFADIMSMQGEEGTVSDCIRRIAQKGRAAGVHLVIATQRASTKIIDGDIKVNFPVKAVFRMAKAVDSVVMLDEAGAEKLLGKGDMLFMPTEAAKPKRLQGCFLSDAEIDRLVYFWGGQRQEDTEQQLKIDSLAAAGAAAAQSGGYPKDPLLETALEMANEHEHISRSFLQRRLHIGYPRAARLMEQLEEVLKNELKKAPEDDDGEVKDSE
jgi:S-DNA-T family DNA segregation ATPase FtsK/SpoIIIE